MFVQVPECVGFEGTGHLLLHVFPLCLPLSTGVRSCQLQSQTHATQPEVHRCESSFQIPFWNEGDFFILELEGGYILLGKRA